MAGKQLEGQFLRISCKIDETLIISQFTCKFTEALLRLVCFN